MNEIELRQYCLEHAGEELPAEAVALLQRDPELKRQVDRLIAVKNLMSLKRHEQPDPASLDRCLRGVRERIARPVSLWDRVRGLVEFEPPALAYGMAALAVAVIGTVVVLNRGGLEQVELARDVPELPQQEVVPEPVLFTVDTAQPAGEPRIEQAIAEAFPAFEKPLIVLRTENTNYQPTTPRMSIGGSPVVPVSYEY